MSADFSALHSSLAAELKANVARLQEKGVVWVGLDADPQTFQHIKERHFNGGDVPGSKFLSTLSDEQIRYIVSKGELSVVSELLEKIKNGADVVKGIRCESKLDFSNDIGDVGTNALIKRADQPDGIIAHRNPDDPRDVPVYLKAVDEAEMPRTSQVAFIGGIYFPEKGKPYTAGFYTLFPEAPHLEIRRGDEIKSIAPPMSEEAFWDAHGLLATKKELGILIGKLTRNGMNQKAEEVKGMMKARPPSQPHRPEEKKKPEAGNIALAIPEDIQALLKEEFEQRYPVFYGEHITLKTGAKWPSEAADTEIRQFRNAKAEVYAIADDHTGVQCLLIRVNGEVRNPNNGRPYHLTWSINPEAEVPADYNDNGKPGKGKPGKAKPVHSGVVADRVQFVMPLKEEIPLRLSAKFFPQIQGTPPVSAPQLAKQ